MKVLYIFFLILCVFMFTCDSGTDPEEENTIQFAPEKLTVASGEDMEISLEMKNLESTIFAMSMHIEYDRNVVSCDDSNGLQSGDFFGNEAICFIKAKYSVIYITITRIQGSEPVSESGKLCSLKFTGCQSGICDLNIATLFCYDSAGNEVNADIKTTPGTITVN